MIKPEQIRMARGALAWTVRDLAKQSGVSANTVSRLENQEGGYAKTIERIQETLEEAGVIFIPSDENGGPGVRLKKDKDS